MKILNFPTNIWNQQSQQQQQEQPINFKQLGRIYPYPFTRFITELKLVKEKCLISQNRFSTTNKIQFWQTPKAKNYSISADGSKDIEVARINEVEDDGI